MKNYLAFLLLILTAHTAMNQSLDDYLEMAYKTILISRLPIFPLKPN